MKKILFVVKNMNVGGVEKSLLSLLNTIDRKEYEVDVLLLEEYGGFMDAIPNWVNVIISKDYPLIKDEVNLPPLQVIKHYLKDCKIVRASKLLPAYILSKATGDYSFYYKAVFDGFQNLEKHYDIAVAYTSIINYLAWLVDYHVDADEYIGWVHFDVSKYPPDRTMLLNTHRQMKKIFIVSQSALDSFVQMFPELKEKCELRYNVVDRKQILRLSEERVECIKEPHVKTIVTLGRLTSEKGQDIVPEVAAKLKEAGVVFRWYLIGDGGLSKIIKEKSKALGVESEVILLGTKINPYPYLKQADLYVQTSIHEGYCITLAEAKVFGVPIVSTEFAGAHEQLDTREDCMVVARNANAIVDGVEKLLNSIGD